MAFLETIEATDTGADMRSAVNANFAKLCNSVTGITASTTHTQGQQPLTGRMNVITVCANADDTVTLPTAEVDRTVIICNRGSFRTQVFPASGDKIDDGSVDASITIAGGSRNRFYAIDGTNWYTW